MKCISLENSSFIFIYDIFIQFDQEKYKYDLKIMSIDEKKNEFIIFFNKFMIYLVNFIIFSLQTSNEIYDLVFVNFLVFISQFELLISDLFSYKQCLISN